MSSLPQIGSGQLMVNGDIQRNAEVRSTLDFDVTNGTARRRNSVYPRPPSILTVSESLPSIHDSRESQRRKPRSRSLDPAAADATQTTAKKRRENDNRSKSHDPRAKDASRSMTSPLTESEELNVEDHIIEDETESEKARKVRFSDNSVTSPMPKANDTNYIESRPIISKTDKSNRQINENDHNIPDKKLQGDNFFAADNKKRTINANTDKELSVPHRKSPFNYDKFARKIDNKVLPNSKTKTKSPRTDYRQDRDVNRKTVPHTVPNSNKRGQVQVYSKKYQLKNWVDTSSDPGLESKYRKLKSIDNDQFIKGRPVDPRRPGFPRQQESEQAKHDERPRAAERGKRQQANEGEHTARSVNSAPSKDREAPVPKLNSFMKEEKSDKDTTDRDRQALEKAKHHTLLEDKPPDKDKTTSERDTGHMKDKGRIDRPKENGQRENERKEKQSILPPDDHGPAFTPTTGESPLANNDQEDPEQFNYYASVNQTPREKPKTDVPLLQLHTKTPTEKSFSTRVIGSDDMHLSSVSPAKSVKSKQITDDMDSDKNKKRREVTIVDPKDLKKTAEEIVEEAFNKEYEYAHNEERRHKDFDEMDEDEKIEFFKSRYRMKPEQIRELTFHPKTNEPKIIHKTYTGIDATDWELAPDSARIKSGRRPKSQHKNAYKKVMVIPTYQRKDFMLSRLQGKIYRHISKVYGSSPRDNREKQFYEKLTQIQLDEYRRRYEMLERNERKRLESLFRQREQLKQLRKKFEKDAWRRFMTQYVTSKVVEAEYSNRKDYGLPNSLDKDLHARRKTVNEMDLSTKDKMNKKRFEHLFKFSTGPDVKVKGKPLKFEGIDTVYIDTEDESDATGPRAGEQVSHRQDVAQLIKEARLLLSQTEMETPRETKQRVKSDKQPSRPAQDTRNRMERPHHHRARERRPTESDHTPPRRSKSRSKTPKAPKTIKDVILRRQSQPVNRYRTSEFLKPSSKAKPTRGSNETLNKDTTNKRPEMRKPPEKREQKSVKETTEETVRLLSVSSSETEKQPKRTKTGINKNTANKPDSGKGKTGSVVSKQEQHMEPARVEHVSDQKQEKRTKVEQKPHTYLEEPETLIGTSRDYDAYSPVKQTVTKTVISRSQSPVSRAGVPSRPTSKASIQTNNLNKSSSISKGFNVASRRESKASVQVQNGTKTHSESPYKQTTPKRAPSVASIVSKANSAVQQNAKNEIKDTVSVKDKDIGNEGSKIPEKVSTHRSVSRSSIHTVNSIYQNDLKPNKRVSKTSVQLQNVVDKVVEKEKEKAMNESPNIQESKLKSVQNSTANLKQVSNSKHVSASPSRASKLDPKINGHNNIEINYDKSHQEPSVKKNVHISETVEVHTKVTDPRKGEQTHPNNIVENGLPDDDSTYVDEKINREDFENRNKVQAREQPERKRSPKPTQARSKLHEGKGPVSKKGKGRQPATTRTTKERKDIAPARKQGKSRFPDIDENDRTIANSRATPKPQMKRSVKYDEVETETVRTVTPSEKQGAAKWKDLVQKYIREPSPVVGKREDLSVLQTKVDTDDSGSEADIFERAKRRYALDVDEDSDDDEE